MNGAIFLIKRGEPQYFEQELKSDSLFEHEHEHVYVHVYVEYVNHALWA